MSRRFVDNDKLDWHKIGYVARSAFAVLLSATVLIGGGWFVYSKAHGMYMSWRTADDYIGEGTEERVEVLIPLGPSQTQVGDILTEAGVVKSTKSFRKAAQESGKWPELKAGRYRLPKELPAEVAFRMLLDPDNQIRLEITFPEGTTVAEQFTIMDTNTKGIALTAKDMQKAAKTPEKLGLPKYAKNKLEGFLFPSTYVVAEPPAAADVLKGQIKQYKKIAEKLSLEGRAKELKVKPFEVVTVASIIAAEVTKPADQPMVAAVIYNRLEKGMKLEMDSTVHYAVGKTGKVTTTAEDRKSKSPYNTYRHEGLPPGPISNPGETALEAALSPADSDALFFVTVDLDTGETRFASTLAEHNANKKIFQAWCAANKDRGQC
ncbi:endolytic transglycosylase MltG [Tessaracoccus sp.]|uniref:endolytic transglycosylase MltG n=1 Tax=Tessaracoccus sp. TaxID=1971211 RepID=UPI002608D7F4|nr:endolytic transglycosylase MltG [Tessaracoccus sp.]